MTPVAVMGKQYWDPILCGALAQLYAVQAEILFT